MLEYLLQYLYSGRCLFPRDDLNLGLDLMAAADQFLLDDMKQQCQLLLSEKIDAEVDMSTLVNTSSACVADVRCT